MIEADVIVIGAGAAGLMAALFAAQGGARVLVLERNEKAGKKLYITGKGRCNVTNVATGDDFLAHIARNPRFLYSALHAFSSSDTMALFERAGVPLVTERGGRVFPVSGKASDITRALEKEAVRAGGRMLLDSRVQSLWLDEDKLCGVLMESGERIRSHAVIIATGGLSYPMTGSTGDGYTLAQQVGHTVEPCTGSLVPIETVEDWPGRLSGLTLQNVGLTASVNGKKVFDERGELLCAHFGITGPLVLSASAHLCDAASKQRTLSIDLKPALSLQQIDARLTRELTQNAKKHVRGALASLLPARILEIWLELCDVSPELPAHQLPRAQRLALGAKLKDMPLTVRALRPVAEAVITRGGVSVREVQPATMMSKKLPGLFFAGEVLDIDAYTGGYNLQLAFSTGSAAGKAASDFARSEKS